jgi:D-tyrosyl-tRNA(Tyr) deacylase
VRAVVQRVAEAKVEIDGALAGAIARGLLVYLGVGKGDTAKDTEWMLAKIVGLRIFEDDRGKMGLSVADAGGALLVVSQFTLYGDLTRGKRPSFDGAMPPGEAERVYDDFVRRARTTGVPVETGRFAADMKVSSLNDGPVTILLESPGSEKIAP